MEIKRILVPTDFSETARAAVDQALFLTAKYDAQLTVLHARLMFEDDPQQVEKGLDALKKEESDVERSIMDRLTEGTAKHAQLNIKHEIIRGYSAPSAILGYINNNDFDLVVIGTHGRSGLEHFLIGSVAEKVVRYARCPVLTVRSSKYIKENFHKIVVPFDFSEPANLALKTAIEFAEKEAELHLIYAVEQEVHPALYAWGMKSVFEIIPDIITKVEERMDEVIGQLTIPAGMKIKKAVVEGKPHKQIAEFVEKVDPDIVVIGTHGLVGLDRFLLGSTTERVIRSVQHPVLTVKNRNVI